MRLRVTDSGTGMDEQIRKRAIEPFFSTKGVGRGTGLGLSMVHGLALQSNGRFELESEPGRGTTALLWLPMATEPARAETADALEIVGAGRRVTVLLVDDEDLVRSTAAETMRELGYEVVEASGAERALEIVRAGLAPDPVVTDHMMPGMTGAELASELRRQRPDLPILLITGYANLDPGRTRGLPVLAKPFRQAELAAALADLVVKAGA